MDNHSSVQEVLVAWVVGIDRSPDHAWECGVICGIAVIRVICIVIDLWVVSPRVLIVSLIEVAIHVIEMLLIDAILRFDMSILSFHHHSCVIFLHFSLLSDYFLLHTLLFLLNFSLHSFIIAHFGD